MSSRLHPSIPLILLLLLALLIFWMINAVVPPMMQTGKLERKPDYIIENLSGIRAEHDSEVWRIFTAEKLLHYVNDDVTYLEQPYFTSFSPQNPVMRIKAEKAELSRNGEDIFLTGNVMASRGPYKENEKIMLLTSFLHLIPDEDLVKTDKSVAIERKNTTINAIGLELDNHTGIIKLLSRVRAVDK